jgi:hypothetical protein
MRLEGNDFKENLSGLWEGMWTYGVGRSDMYHLKISKLDGNKVHLTGYVGGGGGGPGSDEVYGRIENSTLLLTWPDLWEGNCKDGIRMRKDNSNNLILVGLLKCGGWSAKSRLKKIE